MTKQKKQSSQAAVREIRRRTRRKFSPEEKIRIVLEGLRGEQSVAELCLGGLDPETRRRLTPAAPLAAPSRHRSRRSRRARVCCARGMASLTR